MDNKGYTQSLEKRLHHGMEVFHMDIADPIHSLSLACETTIKAPIRVWLYNPTGIFIGEVSMGYSHFIPYVYISRVKATMNGLAHDLIGGSYKVVIFTYEEEAAFVKDELMVRFNITVNEDKAIDKAYLQEEAWYGENGVRLDFDHCIKDEAKYYKGDFHGHSIYSDGKNQPSQVAKIVRQQGLDFIALTEHNTIPFGYKKLGCLPIPSFELTLDMGHMNIHGVHRLAFPELVQSSQNPYDLLHQTLETYTPTANISMNHMFLEPWHFQDGDFDMRRIHTLEIICDPTYPTSPEANDKAARFLDFLWEAGFKIYGIGGSDSHNLYEERYEGASLPSVYGDPATYVHCHGLSINHVIDGIKHGHCYVARFVQLDINIMHETYLPGQQIGDDVRELTYQIKVKNCCSTYRGRFICNGRVIKQQMISKKNSTMKLTIILSEDPFWLRFGLYDEDGHVIAYVNPIYNKLNEIAETKLSQLLEKFGEQYDKRYII
ncbi:PHP domain-containing protein [Vallitalea pronyensis]|uniref:PHP domain-containing protein n=1 Tax=Vallitalea pronyensis TaxID=1348613 RepID=A0A8J8MJF1_9FIRM|nr:CehA/McbA family metallohydrolase [Vallitalea pronyensis]QUI22611.1 PHP domain-containing protein [Vallitalea pronyensis]